MADDSSSSRRPPKKRVFRDPIFDSSSDEDEDDVEVISIKSSSGSSSYGSSSSGDSTLDSSSSPSLPNDTQRSFSQITASSALATQPTPVAKASTEKGTKKERKMSSAPSDSLAALSNEAHTLKLTKVTNKSLSHSRKRKSESKVEMVEEAEKISPKKKRAMTETKDAAKKPESTTKKSANVNATKRICKASPAQKVRQTKDGSKADAGSDTGKTSSASRKKKAARKPAESKPGPADMTKPEEPKAKDAPTPKISSPSVAKAKSKKEAPSANDPPSATKKSKDMTTASAKKKDPPKPKKKKLNFQDQVLHHMLISFKPFTLKTLAEALKTTDTALNYVMLSLLDKGLVIKKEFTSSKGRVKTLYWANHGAKAKEVQISIATPEEINQAKLELAGLRAKEAALLKALNGQAEELSNTDLANKLDSEEAALLQLQQQLNGVKARIRSAKEQPKKKPLVGKSATQVAKEQCPLLVKIRINNMRLEWKKRQEKCADFVDQLADGLEKKPKEVIKLLDLETDEMVGVTMPPKHVIE